MKTMIIPKSVTYQYILKHKELFKVCNECLSINHKLNKECFECDCKEFDNDSYYIEEIIDTEKEYWVTDEEEMNDTEFDNMDVFVS